MSTPLQLNCTFQKEGYVVMRQVLSQQSIDQLRQQIQKTLHACAHELECTFEQYLSAVSRWVATSPVLADIPQLLIERVFQSIEKILREPVSLQRINVISKNKYSFDKIPFHQDISYSREAPYQLSSWLALHDTHEKNGPLAVIPRSHFWPIEKAVDFWSPDYEPNLDREKHAVKLAIKAGDMILFDSRLWHGSSQNDSHEDRFAVVTRWSSKSWIPPTPIPPIEPLRFGMWTCGKMTENLLKKGLETILNDSKEEFLGERFY